jgi:hypothetical protein
MSRHPKMHILRSQFIVSLDPWGCFRRACRGLDCIGTGLRDMLWSPTVRAALLAGTPWLDVFCPGCGTSRAIDLRTIDRHPLVSVGTLVLGLRCSWCPGSAPMPKLLGLYALPPVTAVKVHP